MTNDTSIIIRTLRAQALERAFGELEAYRNTFWDDVEDFEIASKLIAKFKDDMSDMLA